MHVLLPSFVVLVRSLSLAATLLPAVAVAQSDDGFGVLVMAHGGSTAWNQDVLQAVEPLRAQYHVEVAFGMADPAALEHAIHRLEAQGAQRIGVVRLFVSGESFLERTQAILGLAPGADPRPPSTSSAEPPPSSARRGHVAHAAGHGGHSMALWRVDSDAHFVLSTEGLADAPEMGDVLVDRARALSRNAHAEDVLVLAHGPGDDAENDRWLAALDQRADAIRNAIPFARVRVATLREDWPEKRAIAEAEVRAFVTASRAAGRTAIVIPFRVSGFGGYAQVLDGLEYRADQRGLIPHDAVTRWIDRQARMLRDAASPDS